MAGKKGQKGMAVVPRLPKMKCGRKPVTGRFDLPQAIPDDVNDLNDRALLAWKKSLNSTKDALKSWNSLDPTPCNCFEVRCSSGMEVVEISLKSMDLQGLLPSNFQSLKFLKTLVLSSNNKLEFVDHSGNLLLGEIPEEICSLRKLHTLVLNTNFLEGEIPSGIGNLSGLVYLTLYDNQLSGGIPKSIGELRKLEVFLVGGNKNLKGDLPWEIGNCTNLLMLGLAETSVSGNLLSSVGMLKRVQTKVV
ncbi:hypothetical protein F3Y22_tig00116958pilonHSYRG00328 [Hibiscus syriacus]|uniref:Leucine-rich repeat-containing N-terminal plant-type domain-containing protein n=1 Tax=Hibiscus syriacus TaxID=106335 RepID=A0A6A2XVA9_HIBSY|nr:hypothetical protein F3Y22_tig00116958pilonHSYRG00328 [Hibiscus syriacus]